MYNLPQYETPTMAELVTRQIKMGAEYLGLDKEISDENLSSFFSNSDFLRQYEGIQIENPYTGEKVKVSDYTKKRLEHMYQILESDQTDYDFDFFETLLLYEMILESAAYMKKRTGDRTGAKWKKFKEEHSNAVEDADAAATFFASEMEQKMKETIEKEQLKGKEATQFKAECKRALNHKIKAATDFPHMYYDLNEDFGLVFWDMDFTLFYTLGLFQGLDFFGIDVFSPLEESPLEEKKEKEDGTETI